MFDDEKPQFKIRVDGDEYLIDLETKVKRGLMLTAFRKAQGRFNVKTRLPLEADKWNVPPTYLNFLNKKTRPILLDVEKQVKRKHPTFKVLSSNLKSCKFEKLNEDWFKATLIFAGLCRE